MAYESPVAGYSFSGPGSDITALVAGFGSSNQDAPTTPEEIQKDRENAAMIASGISGEESQKFQPFAPDFDPVANPIDNPPETPWTQAAPKIQLSRVGAGQAIPENLPHPLLKDPRFASLYRQDSKAAGQLYGNLTGRDLKSDIGLQSAQAKTQGDLDKTVVSNLIEKNDLRFNDVTGEPEIMVKDNPMPQPLRDVSPVQYQSLMRSYEAVTGNKIPEGIKVPNGLTSEEAIQFRQKVHDNALADTSKDDWQTKIQRAYNRTYKEGWNAQQNSAAIAANPATKSSGGTNAPGFFARNVARAANLPINLNNAVNRPIRNFLGSTFGDSPFMRSLAGSKILSDQEPISASQISASMAGMGDFSNIPLISGRGVAETY